MNVDSILAGRYRLIALIGRGGMGSVWRAEHLGLSAPVAVKLMDPALGSSRDALDRFLREAQAAATLRSPHVVQILDYGVDEATDVPFIAMELMEGESLAQRLARVRRLSAAETARFISHVARALTRAHEAGITHRDLKPDNIFIVRNEDEEIAKVLDFGIAKADANAIGGSSSTRTGAVLGTPYYMSPEQISGSKQIDYRTDLWALGVIAFECLTARRPFDADTVGGLAIEICTREPCSPSSVGPVPRGFDAWFARAMARNPVDRFASAREMSEELRRVCGSSSPLPEELNAGPPLVSTATVDARSFAVVSVTPSLPIRSGAAPWPRRALLAGGLGVAAVGVAAWLVRTGGTKVAPHGDEVRATEGSAAGAAASTSSPAPEVAPAPAVADQPARGGLDPVPTGGSPASSAVAGASQPAASGKSKLKKSPVPVAPPARRATKPSNPAPPEATDFGVLDDRR